MADEKSKKVLAAILNYKLTHDMDYISEIADASEEQYFDVDVIQYDQKDVFVDCGSYIGDTIQQYIKNNNNCYESIVCIETDIDNCEIIRKNVLPSIKGELHELACWNEKATLLFDKIGSGSGTLNVNNNTSTEKIEVNADTIDHILNGRRETYIKMDIEGAEYKALIGAIDTIQKWYPTLMISVYHKQDDLVKLPALIKSLNEDYRFYLRHYRSKSIQESILYAVARKREVIVMEHEGR